MNAVRRGYIYIASFISLQAVSWALIYLLQNLLGPTREQFDLAWQLAVIVIGLPIFVGHWLWGNRLVNRSTEERGSLIRRLYLYGVLATFLGPLMAQIFYLLNLLLQMAAGIDLRFGYLQNTSQGTQAWEHFLAAIVLTILGAYHFRALQRDQAVVSATAGLEVIRRLFQWGFVVAGLTMTIIAMTELLRWLLERLLVRPSEPANILPELARLVVGVAVWLLFWRWSQNQFARDMAGERSSVLRKLVLYAILFVGLVLAVGNAAALWADILERLLGGSRTIRIDDPLPFVIAGGVLWGYHVVVLQRDARVAPFREQQATIRQIYQYLIASVGLLALLIGIGGLLSLLIRSAVGETFSRGDAAWFIAAVTAGLPVWLWPWRKLQRQIRAEGPEEMVESGSLVRRIYLYGFVLIATFVILASGIYLVYQFFLILFGLQNDPLIWSDLTLAFAYGLLGFGVWVYHGRLIRFDSRRIDQARAKRLAAVQVVVLADADDELAAPLLEAIGRAAPGVTVHRLFLGQEAAAEEEGGEPSPVEFNMLETADIIVGSWRLAARRDFPGLKRAGLAKLLEESSAHKIVVPDGPPGWRWAGLDHQERSALVDEAAELVEKLVLVEGGVSSRTWGVGTIITVVIGAVILVSFLIPAVISLVEILF